MSKSWSSSVIAKVIVIAVIILALDIPLIHISWLTEERQSTYSNAVQEVSSKWGSPQQLAGPILTVPYTSSEKTREYAHFLPFTLSIQASLAPEVRQRGIYQINLYSADTTITAHFDSPNLSALGLSSGQMLWREARISLGLSDMRGLNSQATFLWDKVGVNFEPGMGDYGLPFASGVSAKFPGLNSQAEHDFEFRALLQGSSSFRFLPMGENTEADVSSSWTTPSFMGGFLPAESNLSDKGFTAHWSVYSFNRGFPQQWTTASPSLPRGALQSSEFGVDLLTTVNTYQQNSRSLKYAMLFLLLTFTSYFLFEVLSKMRIHPLQYLFVGFAMCVFYLLLLSMSEHIAFLSSYLISSAATVVLISLYSVWVLRGKLRALLMAFLLTFIYGYLYVLLQLQDYALLIGSLSLFVVLALVMFLTRKLDWYEVTVNEGK